MTSHQITPVIIASGTGAAVFDGGMGARLPACQGYARELYALFDAVPLFGRSAQAKVALAAISGISGQMECVFEVVATGDGVRHALLVPRAVREPVASALVGAMPGLHLSDGTPPEDGEAVALAVGVRALAVLSSDAPEGTLPVLAALALAPGEQVLVRLAISADSPPAPHAGERRSRADKDAERSWRDKTTLPTFRVQGLILVRAARPARARALAEHVASLIRSRRRAVTRCTCA